MLIIEIELSFGSQIYPKPTPFVQSVLWFCQFYRQSVATQSIDLLQPNALRCESCLFFAIFVLKCAKVVVSSVWLVIANWFVIVYRVDGRGRLFFSRLIQSVIFAVNRWVRLHFLSVVQFCRVQTQENQTGYITLHFLTILQTSLWIYLNRLINVQLPLDMRFIKWSEAGFDQ